MSSQATLNGSDDPVAVHIVIGDGVNGDWSIRLDGNNIRNRVITGKSDDAMPDVATYDAKALADANATLSWTVVLYGPHTPVPFHVGIKVKQGRHSILNTPIRLHGTLPASDVKVLSGNIQVLPAPDKS